MCDYGTAAEFGDGETGGGDPCGLLGCGGADTNSTFVDPDAIIYDYSANTDVMSKCTEQYNG